MEFCPNPKFFGIPWKFSILPSSKEVHGTWKNWYSQKLYFSVLLSVFDRWLYAKYHRNATYCIDFNIIFRIWYFNAIASAKRHKASENSMLLYIIMFLIARPELVKWCPLNSWTSLYSHGLTLISTVTTNHMHRKVRDVIIYPSNSSGCTLKLENG